MKFKTGLALATIISSCTAMADEANSNADASFTPFSYAGGFFTNLSVSSNAGAQDFSYMALGGVWGHQFDRYFGVEGEFAFSLSPETDDLTTEVIGQKVEADYSTFGVYLTAKSKGEFYAKGRLGLANSSFSYSSEGYEDEDESTYGLAYGIGAGFTQDRLSFELEYTKLPEVDDPVYGNESYDPSMIAFKLIYSY